MMKAVIGPRRELGMRTIFNVLGPLTNPAGAGAQVVGVYDPTDEGVYPRGKQVDDPSVVAGMKGTLPGVDVARPAGGMYAFFRVAGQADSLAFARRLVEQHGLGLAPGIAFGPEGEGWLRWCFASRDPARLDRGLARLDDALRL